MRFPVARRLLLPIIVAAGALLRLAIAWAPVNVLLRRTVPDDAFYYYTIARNLAHGLGPTFDRLAPTNGFQPLWLAIITPLFVLIDDRITALHMVLTLCAAIDTASVCLLYRLLRNHGISHAAALTVGAMYALSPMLLSHAGAMNGLETGLDIFIILLYLPIYFRTAATGTLSRADVAKLAACTLLLFLVRTDNVVIIAVTYAHMLIAMRRIRASRLKLVIAGAIAAYGAVPWLLWSLALWGSPVPVSGRSVASKYAVIAPAILLMLLLFIPIARAIDAGIDYVHSRPARVRWTLGSAAAALAIAGYAAGYMGVFELQSRNEVKYVAVIPAMQRLLPAGTRVGAWNAGIYGYFFEQGNVVNLNGVVNNAAYDHIVDHSLRDYCRSVGIAYIVDDAGTLRDMAQYWSDSTRDIGSDIEIIDVVPAPANDTTVIGRMR